MEEEQEEGPEEERKAEQEEQINSKSVVEDLNMMKYRGVEYETSFGKLVRKLDRETAIKNENQRLAFFRNREK